GGRVRLHPQREGATNHGGDPDRCQHGLSDGIHLGSPCEGIEPPFFTTHANQKRLNFHREAAKHAKVCWVCPEPPRWWPRPNHKSLRALRGFAVEVDSTFCRLIDVPA